ncbi:MAG TPA: hypothetical protein VFQ06_05455 [Nitrospira sp.]|nr:hypothetical protein [Nitrospira sp.]
MAQLGFPHHETIHDAPKFPRLRTCFFRTPPRPAEPIRSFLKPLPELLPEKDAILKIRERDVAYLSRSGEPVSVIGREPMLSLVKSDLSDYGVEVREQIVLPGEGSTPRGILNELTKGKSGLIVLAAPDVIQIVRHLVVLDRFRYAFVSFAMARQ